MFWCSFAFLCGLLCGVMYSYKHRIFDAGRPAAHADAFDQWQEAASGAGGQVDFKTRERLLPLMAQSDGPRAWKMLMQTGVKPRMTDIEQVAHHWAKRDGRAAAAFGLAIPDPIERRAFLSMAVSRWFGEAPQAFLEWLSPQPDREMIVSCMSYSEYGKLLKAEAASLDFFTVLHEGNPHYQGPHRNLVLRIWQHQDQKEAVMAWLRRQPESELRDYAWRDIANDLAATDASAAAALAKEVTSPNVRRYLVSTVAAWMARRNVPAAFTYAESLQDELSRDSAWKSVFGTWMMHDPAAALEHVRQHLDSITADTLKPLRSVWMACDPVESLKLVQQLQGTEESRKSILDEILRDWLSRSCADLLHWLASPEAEWLSPQDLKRYLQQAETHQPSGGGSSTIQGRRVWFGY